ncbi:MAG: glycosyltransferase [Candidatus Omnitrophica bacterium]|nr:glycosyltransferase [Candidatus Omnitrophota bacterium]
MKISVLMPVYNEKRTIEDILQLVRGIELDKEIILVDDKSTDGTRELLKELFGDRKDEVRVIYHQNNSGKGASIRTALREATGDYVIVQDADLEYSPHDMVKLYECAEETKAVAVYGSRFLEGWRSTSFLHYMVNRFLTSLTNVLFGSSLTDMETCYKMIRTDVMKELDIRSSRFELEPEITAKLLKKGYSIREVPISYRGRTYDEGKKIGWRDGVEALWTIFRQRFTG